MLIHVVAPQRHGVITLTQIFAPYLFVPLIALIPLAFRRGYRPLWPALLMCGVVFGLRFGPSVISLPPLETPDATRFSAITWNLYVDNDSIEVLRQVLNEAPANVVALQELTTEQASAIRNDPQLQQRYPAMLLVPGGADGMGILSTLPIVEQGVLYNPRYPNAFPVLWARIALDDTRQITVVNAHPRQATFARSIPRLLLTGIDPRRRDEEIAFIRSFVEERLERGEHVLLLGDFNLTEREPAYAELAAQLQDAHRQVGIGIGHTWRLHELQQLPLALLRIDYIWSSRGVVPLRTDTDCTPRGSDHCLLRGVFEIN